jgi:hypothetical protein
MLGDAEGDGSAAFVRRREAEQIDELREFFRTRGSRATPAAKLRSPQSSTIPTRSLVS